jgi:hypothetical protein
MIHLLALREGDRTFRSLLDVLGEDLRSRMRIVHYEDLAGLLELPAGMWVFGNVERLRGEWFEVARRAHRALSSAPDRALALNDPAHTLRRYDLQRALVAAGRNDFRTFRLNEVPGDLRFPVFLRFERWHLGTLTPLLQDRRTLRHAIAEQVLRGQDVANLLVVEFMDTSVGGVFRKYGAFVVGTHVVPKHVFASTDWMIKSLSSEPIPEVLAEEDAYVRQNPHRDDLLEVARLGRLGYGRIDYGIRDGKVQVWEANNTPTVLPGGFLAPTRAPITAEFFRNLARAFEDQDLPDDAPPIPVTFPRPERPPRPRTPPRAVRRMWAVGAGDTRRRIARAIPGPVRRLVPSRQARARVLARGTSAAAAVLRRPLLRRARRRLGGSGTPGGILGP